MKLGKQLKETKYSRPFSEWRIPIMILMVSSVFFVLLTAMFGVTIDTRTHEVAYNFDGWNNKPIEDGVHNPMNQFPDFTYVVMIIGYYMGAVCLIYLWFDYCKWKWEKIPIEHRIEYREHKKKTIK